ncbi:MAG: hypothetical protein ACO3VS_00885, partial [Limisphaerales bacterium]
MIRRLPGKTTQKHNKEAYSQCDEIYFVHDRLFMGIISWSEGAFNPIHLAVWANLTTFEISS